MCTRQTESKVGKTCQSLRAGKPPLRSKMKNKFNSREIDMLMTLPLSQAESCWFQCWTPPGCCRLTVLHTHTETSCICPWAPPPPPVWASLESAPASRCRPGSERKHRRSSWRSANTSPDYGESGWLERWQPGRTEPTPSHWSRSTAAGTEGRCR